MSLYFLTVFDPITVSVSIVWQCNKSIIIAELIPISDPVIVSIITFRIRLMLTDFIPITKPVIVRIIVIRFGSKSKFTQIRKTILIKISISKTAKFRQIARENCKFPCIRQLISVSVLTCRWNKNTAVRLDRASRHPLVNPDPVHRRVATIICASGSDRTMRKVNEITRTNISIHCTGHSFCITPCDSERIQNRSIVMN